MVNPQIKENSGKEDKQITAKGSEPMDEDKTETPKETTQQEAVLIEAKGFNAYYDGVAALKNINLQMQANNVVAIIGPSGCGKSTFLRSINRMNDLIDGTRLTGRILLDAHDIYDRGVDVVHLRKRVGMVFQKPNPFPMSIYDNIAYGPRIHGITNGKKLNEIVEK